MDTFRPIGVKITGKRDNWREIWREAGKRGKGRNKKTED
jgi:hypothetical protein